MKTLFLILFTLFLLQAAALAAASSVFDSDLEGLSDDDDGVETLYLIMSLLLYSVLLSSHLFPPHRDPSVFEQKLMWADYVCCVSAFQEEPYLHPSSTDGVGFFY